MTTQAQARAAYRELLQAMPPEGTPCTRNPKPYQTPEGADYAKALCQRRCPVREMCYLFGDKYRLEGIFGGTDETEREHYRRQDSSRRAARTRYQTEQHTLDDELFSATA